MKKPNTLVMSLTASLLLASILFLTYRLSSQSSAPSKKLSDDEDIDAPTDDQKSKIPESPNKSASSTPATPRTKNSNNDNAKSTTPELSITEKVHKQVEEIDKRGKQLYKAKDYLPAAACFTEALDLLSSLTPEQSHRQVVTITNNRSAMYEKAGIADLALDDCERILEMDKGHLKARLRRLRVLEGKQMWMPALVEVCALQLNYLNENRDKIRMGSSIPEPPVSQSKIEDLLGHILPLEVDDQYSRIQSLPKPRPLPSNHTIFQLLQSFSGYNSWMSQAARDGNVITLTKQIEEVTSDADKAVLLHKRGVRYAYDGDFKKTCVDIDAAYSMIENDESMKSLMGSDDYMKILEWVGMCRHLRYDLKGADKCYRECSSLNPSNVELLVKRAGVKMDDGNKEESLKLFKDALELDPSATDALLHRANLYMLQQDTTKAKEDLEQCLKLQPNNLIARLRLATVYMTLQDLANAKKHLDLAEELDENSSEVHSYRGEMHFAMGEVNEAKKEFDKAIKADPLNPTPYVNAALAVMNTVPVPGTAPDVKEAILLFEKAIEVDPQFHAAYVQLGQLKLSAAQNLTQARSVISLYDEGIHMCRTKEELKDICSMRILTVAQVDAASSLGMETLNMQ
mmetsp:Transcript_20958/g.25950  ORF Transcript_20958/g.25950 Transcript_20958/m.25950 type:complete len:628 (-) Transcript_20958:188-2071(-)